MTVTLALVLITCMISITGFNNPEVTRRLAHYPIRENRNKEIYRWITAGFVHADAFHLFVNMFVLYFFGEYIESQFKDIHGNIPGAVIYTAFYIFIILLANLPSYKKHSENPLL